MNILIVADALELFKIYKDTTFSMMREAQRRGHRMAACEPRHLSWRSGDVVHAELREITLTRSEDDWFQVTRTEVRPLRDFDAILMRKDPPFDSEFFYATHLLEQAERVTSVGLTSCGNSMIASFSGWSRREAGLLKTLAPSRSACSSRWVA